MAFFDELAKGDVIVDEELLKFEDFLHAYFATTIESCKYKGMFYSLSCAYLKKPLIRSLS